ncbi:MAG: UDP-N-acetylmuramate--L-alanine ligase [Bacteroidota bacterium]
MKFENITHVYFIGIGGIGMSALARYFKAIGKQVAGYDKTQTALTEELKGENIDVHFNDDVQAIPLAFMEANRKSNILVVYTPAIPKDHSELNFFSQQEFTVVKRSQVLGVITSMHKTLALAGTHGKTTTSSILAHILKTANINVAAFLGGIARNYNSNIILPVSEHEVINVVEADEFDRSFLTLFPFAAAITSMDADHLDIYGSGEELKKTYQQFASQVDEKGLLVLRNGLQLQPVKALTKFYAADSQADYFADKISIRNHRYCFNFHSPDGIIEDLSLGLPGRHNVENAVAAIALAMKVGVKEESVRMALQSYKGVKRRFDIRFSDANCTFIDDYAHHPEELRAAIMSAHELFEGKKITGIFQPHLFSRTRDFADEFAASLALLDEIILLDIYPARELPLEGITSSWLMNKIKNANKIFLNKTDVLDYINKREPEVLITLGAGDIDTLVTPIQQLLEKKYSVHEFKNHKQ